jgi:hypothetical protein
MVAVDYLSARRFPRFHTDQRAPIAPEIFTFTGRIGPAGDAIELITVDIFLIDYQKACRLPRRFGLGAYDGLIYKLRRRGDDGSVVAALHRER